MQYSTLLPVWIDCFGTPTYKQSWLSLVLFTPYVSFVLGYVLTGFVVANGFEWMWVYYAIDCLLLPCFAGFLFTPYKYTSIEPFLEMKRSQEARRKYLLIKQNPQDEELKALKIQDSFKSFGNLGAITAKQVQRLQPRAYVENLAGD